MTKGLNVRLYLHDININRVLTMKIFVNLIVIICLSSCSGDAVNTETVASPVPTAPTAGHLGFYPNVAQPVSFSDVTSLVYQASIDKQFYGDSALQYVEYWAPTPDTVKENLPAIVFIHGGCWSNSYRINQSYPIATALALNGFHVWSVEYRSTGDQGGGWPGTYHDVEQALQFITGVADDYYSPRNLVVLGHSAGGHLALLAKSNLATQAKVVGLAAISDLISYANESGGCNSLAASFMSGLPADIPEQYALANPLLENLTDDAYLFAGEMDTIVNTRQASESGNPFELVAETGHFDWLHPGTSSFSVLLNYLQSL